jgi:hypothetical protein
VKPHPYDDDFGSEGWIAVKYAWGDWATISQVTYRAARRYPYGLAVMFANVVEWRKL